MVHVRFCHESYLSIKRYIVQAILFEKQCFQSPVAPRVITAEKNQPCCSSQDQPKLQQPRAMFLKRNRPEGPIRNKKQQEQPKLQHAIESKAAADNISPTCSRQYQPRLQQPRAARASAASRIIFKKRPPEGPIGNKMRSRLQVHVAGQSFGSVSLHALCCCIFDCYRRRLFLLLDADRPFGPVSF